MILEEDFKIPMDYEYNIKIGPFVLTKREDYDSLNGVMLEWDDPTPANAGDIEMNKIEKCVRILEEAQNEIRAEANFFIISVLFGLSFLFLAMGSWIK